MKISCIVVVVIFSLFPCSKPIVFILSFLHTVSLCVITIFPPLSTFPLHRSWPGKTLSAFRLTVLERTVIAALADALADAVVRVVVEQADAKRAIKEGAELAASL